MKKIVVFDICFTLYDCNTTSEFFRYLRKNYLLKYILFSLFNKICILLKFFNFFDKNRVIFLKGIEVNKIEEQLSSYYDNILKNKVNKDLLVKLEYYKDSGYDIYLISASIEPIVNLIANKLGVKAGYGTSLISNNGFYTGKISNDLLGKSSKEYILKDIINKNGDIDFLSSYAYSDSENDLKQWSIINNKFLVNDNTITNYD